MTYRGQNLNRRPLGPTVYDLICVYTNLRGRAAIGAPSRPGQLALDRGVVLTTGDVRLHLQGAEMLALGAPALVLGSSG